MNQEKYNDILVSYKQALLEGVNEANEAAIPVVIKEHGNDHGTMSSELLLRITEISRKCIMAINEGQKGDYKWELHRKQ